MKHLLKYLSVLLPLVLCGCEGYIQTDDTPQLIVEGWIEDGGYPIVKVTTSVAVSELPAAPDSLVDHMVRWARVKVGDGTKEVWLTGMRSKNHFPPYIYTTSDIKGEVGKTYTLTVGYGTAHCTAEATIPATVPITGIRTQAQSDSLFKVFVQFTDPAEERNHYRLFVKVDGRDSTWTPSLFGLSGDSGMSGASEMQLRRGYGLDMEAYTADFRLGETVHIRLCTLTEQMYSYWKEFDNNLFYGRTPFFPAKETARGNVEGACGYWAGYGASTTTVKMPESAL